MLGAGRGVNNVKVEHPLVYTLISEVRIKGVGSSHFLSIKTLIVLSIGSVDKWTVPYGSVHMV